MQALEALYPVIEAEDAFVGCGPLDQISDIPARAECRPRPGEDHGPDGLIVGCLLTSAQQLLEGSVGDGIAPLRSIQADPADRSAPLDDDFIRHGSNRPPGYTGPSASSVYSSAQAVLVKAVLVKAVLAEGIRPGGP
jgi:hypothetical protein